MKLNNLVATLGLTVAAVFATNSVALAAKLKSYEKTTFSIGREFK